MLYCTGVLPGSKRYVRYVRDVGNFGKVQGTIRYRYRTVPIGLLDFGGHFGRRFRGHFGRHFRGHFGGHFERHFRGHFGGHFRGHFGMHFQGHFGSNLGLQDFGMTYLNPFIRGGL